MAVNNPTDIKPLLTATEAADARAARIEKRLTSAGLDSRAAWSGAGVAVFTVAGGAAITLAIAAASPNSGVSSFPAYIFGAVAFCGLYVLVAPLLRWWPFRAPGSVADLLDERIRAGREARERITYHQLGWVEEANEAARWILKTANLLHARYPAIADRFLLAEGNEDSFSGQALAIQTINAKLAVLADARTGVPT